MTRYVCQSLTADRGAFARIASIAGKVSLAIGVCFEDTIGRAQFFIELLTLGGLGLLFLSLVLSSRSPAEATGAIDVDADALLLHFARTTKRVPRREITSAYVVRQFAAGIVYAWVEIRTRAGTTYLARMAEPQGHALVSELGFGPNGRVVAIDLAPASRRFIHIFLGYLAYVGGIAVANGWKSGLREIAIVATTALVYTFLKRLVRAPIIRIGTDAIEIVTGMSRRRVRREEVSRFNRPEGRGPLVVELKNGKSIRVHRIVLDSARIGAAVDIANQRLGSGVSPERAAVFERGDRDVGAWRAHVRGILEQSGYRAAGATLDDAARVVASPSATLEQRIGAALALRGSGAPLDAVRIAAEGAVDPAVRRTFIDIAEGEDARVQETLGNLTR